MRCLDAAEDRYDAIVPFANIPNLQAGRFSAVSEAPVNQWTGLGMRRGCDSFQSWSEVHVYKGRKILLVG